MANPIEVTVNLEEGPAGPAGWRPVLAPQMDGARIVIAVDWADGEGDKPTAGYLGDGGLVATAADALDFRGQSSVAAPETVALHAILTEMVALYGLRGEIVTLAALGETIDAIADDVEALAPLAGALAALGDRLAAIDALAARTDEIDTLGAIADELTAIYADLAKIQRLYTSADAIDRVNDSADDLDAVADQAVLEGIAAVADNIAAVVSAAQKAADAEAARDLTLGYKTDTQELRDAAVQAVADIDANTVYQDLASIAASKAVAANAVFIYDTSKDSDGGAWARRIGFPALAAIVGYNKAGTVNSLVIYDLTDPAAPEYMSFHTHGFNDTDSNMMGRFFDYAACITAAEGIIAIGSTEDTNGAAFGGLTLINFPADTGEIYRGIGDYSSGWANGLYKGGIADRNSHLGLTPNTAKYTTLAAENVRSVAMKVLPGAPINPVTGLPVPTIAAATLGGLSIIKDDGAVVSISNSDSTDCRSVFFTEDDRIAVMLRNADRGYRIFDIPGATFVNATHYNRGSALEWYASYPGSPFDLSLLPNVANTFLCGVDMRKALATGHDKGLTLVQRNPAIPTEGMVAYITGSYNSGWQPGGIKGAWLASTDTTSLVGGADTDRSINGAALNVTGTITRTPVATGAELVGYGGFSAANWLSVAAADFDPGTDDFALVFWFYGSTANRTLFSNVDDGAGAYLQSGINAYYGSNGVSFGATNGGFSTRDDVPVTGGGVYNTWRMAVCQRNGSQIATIVDGRFKNAKTIANATESLSGGGDLQIGYSSASPTAVWPGRFALIRHVGRALTDDEVARIYADELPLFKAGAACTLYGASDAVTALAHDKDTGLLHVGTSAGRSAMNRLVRAANTTTTPVTTAISAVGGTVVEQ